MLTPFLVAHGLMSAVNTTKPIVAYTSLFRRVMGAGLCKPFGEIEGDDVGEGELDTIE